MTADIEDKILNRDFQRMTTQLLARRPQPVLWTVLVALVLVVLGNHQHLKSCTGNCCLEEVATACCSTELPEAMHPAPSGDCCCCSTEPDSDPSKELGDELKKACSPDCCVILEIEIEVAPFAWPSKQAESGVAAIVTPEQLVPTPQVRRLAFVRPYDRGPPRVDRCTAIRACTQLLI